MDKLILYTKHDILTVVNRRQGETKLGEQVQVTDSLDKLKNSTAQFVILGIPEDIGVRANYGIGGTNSAFPAALKALLNIQSNPFLTGDEILILGHFEIMEPTDQSINGLRNKTNEIDALVYPVIQQIISAGKTPIVIGGGHNNAAPIIAGATIALNRKLNVVNIDAHADLRSTTEGRHSGNGFSFALQHGHLNEYRVFGLQQNYVQQHLPAQVAQESNIKFFYLEDLLQSPLSVKENWVQFTKSLATPCGLEIDLDGVEMVLSSAQTPSGFSLNDIRKILLLGNKAYTYLHICEGAIALTDGRTAIDTGKTIAYLVTDFIKALLPRISQQL